MIARPFTHLRPLLACTLLLLLAGAASAFDDSIDSPMYRIPDLPAPPVVTVFPKGLKELWLHALKRPEVEMRVRAAEAIVLAHERGLPGMKGTVDPLIEVLGQPEQHAAVRLAAVRALVALDARQSAPALFAQVPRADLELGNLIEPVLARWDHQPMRGLWLDRLAAATTPPRSLTLAIQGLAAVREDKAVERLRALVAASSTAAPIRLEAARALGAIRADGLVADAQKLAADDTERGLIGRLAAAHLLQRHQDQPAIALLRRLLRDRAPAVVVLAGGRLLAIDVNLLIDSARQLAGNADPGVRTLAVDVLSRVPSPAHLRMLSDRLADTHLGVRRKARTSLRQLARQDKLRPQIIGDGMRVLAGEDWRGQEQATILLADLDHKPAAPRCIELLSSTQAEVNITAAWALRRLAVSATLAPVLDHVRAEYQRLAGGALPAANHMAQELFDHKLSQLNQLLGQQKYTAAEPVLRLFVPKRASPGAEARAAAIWALGLLHEGKLDAKLATTLVARMEDNGIPPEDLRVCRMAAVAIGRMKAAQALPSLRRIWTGKRTGGLVDDACGWAIAQITGEPMPALVPTRRMQRDWFLLPEK